MNPLGTRARVEELARLLDGAVAGPGALAAGHAVLATRLRALAPALEPRLAPRPEFRAALRQRLVAVATIQAATAQAATAQAGAPYAAPLARPTTLEAAVSWSQSRRGQRRLGVTAGAMAGVVALTGVGIAASRSLPGQPFYSLKRGTEGVQLDLAHGDTAKGTKHLEFAATRLREVRALAHGDGELSLGGGTVPVAGGAALGGSLQHRVNETLSDFDRETRSGSALLQRAFRASGKDAPLRILTSFSTQQQVRLASIIPDLPAGSRDAAQQSLSLVTQVGSTADQLLSLGTCGASCAPASGGPTLPTEPVPTRGATAVPSGSSDGNGVPPCVCLAPTPEQTPEPSPGDPQPAPAPADSSTPQPSPSPTPTPTTTPTPGPGLPDVLPTAVTTLLPTPVTTLLTTPLPVPVPPLPTLPPLLPTPQPSVLPSLLSLLPTPAPRP